MIFARTTALVFFGAALASHPLPAAPTPPLPIPPAQSEGPRAVSTFACTGLYWAPPEGAVENTCRVSYRPSSGGEWRDGLPLWFDPRNREYRGSIVGLQPATSYEIRLSLEKAGTTSTLTSTTWTENLPIARTVHLPPGASNQTLEITEGGTPNGYVLYTSDSESGSEIDIANTSPNCISVKVPYVIIRGLTLRGATEHGIKLVGPVHDVVIEDCDISGWGRISADGFGKNLDAGISGLDQGLSRIVIQRNKIHHPRANANDWLQDRPDTGEKSSSHPNGPQAVVFLNSAGNNVIRYNEVYSDENHRFNDGMGGGENFSFRGFPGPDSDVYGNIIRNTIDDALEIEGGGCNVRVWENLMEETFTGVATASCSIGPLYVFRNILGLTRSNSGAPDALENTGIFGKLGDSRGYGGGRIYYFHNTILQPPGTTPDMRPLGAGWALADWGGMMTNIVSRNNIWTITPNLQQVYLHFHGDYRTNPYSIVDHRKSATNDLDYDLINAEPLAHPQAEAHAVRGVPFFAGAEGTSRYTLNPASPGHDAGERLPNFNDDFAGKGPDIGAAEMNGQPLRFGIPTAP